jgi:ribonucleoside-diphosphate reductase alpha chain
VLAKTEGLLFKYGSGTGTNFSALRGSEELLAGGGIASGPVSFMRGFDAFAGVIKSGGKTRRSAKMVILDCDHPDIDEFIECKVSEERKAWALLEAGYSGGLSGEAYSSVFFQNSNNSVRVTDEFMRAVERREKWPLRSRTTGEVVKWADAHELFTKMAECAWACGDPGMQYDTTINDWHTCAETTRINASNPCSEYMFVDDSACNLASLNLMKFRREDGSFDVVRFRAAVRVFITAMDIIVDNAAYPTPRIEANSHKYRPLGLGYANLGALLMSRGLAYDSDEGRATAGAITALLTGESYRTSAEIADRLSPCDAWEDNQSSFLRVIRKHREAVSGIDSSKVSEELLAAAQQSWDEALERGQASGYKNCQTTVLAPTGTIAFFMDCDTTGIEPDIALVKYKKLAGGGVLKIVNNTVPAALATLGYSPAAVDAIIEYIDEHDTIEGAPGLATEHLSVFDCAFRPAKGERSIHHSGHLRMMAATQPFLSGAISKTVNLPEHVSVAEVAECYQQGWKLGLKAVAIYRNGCKKVQPLATHRSETEPAQSSAVAARKARAKQSASGVRRRRLPDERLSITHKFSVAGHAGYITVGMYEDGSPGEIFIVMSKEGSTVSGLMDGFATAISMALQYGVPLKVLVKKFSHMRFEPSGITGNADIRFAKSLLDYIFRWLGQKFLTLEQMQEINIVPPASMLENGGDRPASGHGHPSNLQASSSASAAASADDAAAGIDTPTQGRPDLLFDVGDAPSCPDCGQIMIRNGACYKCCECGATSGCS